MVRTKHVIVGFTTATVLAIGVAGCSSSSSTPAASTPAETSSVTALPTGDTGGNTAALPAGWPSDIPAPEGIPLQRVIQSPTAPTGKIAIYYGTGDKAAVDTQMTNGLKSAGYKQVSSSSPNANISISSWKKGGTTVGLNINSAAGKVTCSVSVNPVG